MHLILNKKRITQSGFTIIELLVVVAIIAILASISVHTLYSYRAKAFNSSSETDLRNLKTAMEASFSDNQTYPNIP